MIGISETTFLSQQTVVADNESNSSVFFTMLIATMVAAFAGYIYLRNKKGDLDDFQKFNSTETVTIKENNIVIATEVDGYQKV